jgi:uncharacterized metal-binding protein
MFRFNKCKIIKSAFLLVVDLDFPKDNMNKWKFFPWIMPYAKGMAKIMKLKQSLKWFRTVKRDLK